MPTLTSFEEFKPWLAEAKKIIEDITESEYTLFLRDPLSFENVDDIEVQSPLLLVVDKIDGVPYIFARISCLLFKEDSIEVLFNEEAAFHTDPIGKDFDQPLLEGTRSARIQLLESLKLIEKSDLSFDQFKIKEVSPESFEDALEPLAIFQTRLENTEDDDEAVTRYQCEVRYLEEKTIDILIRKVDDHHVLETMIDGEFKSTRYLQPAIKMISCYLNSL